MRREEAESVSMWEENGIPFALAPSSSLHAPEMEQSTSDQMRQDSDLSLLNNLHHTRYEEKQKRGWTGELFCLYKRDTLVSTKENLHIAPLIILLPVNYLTLKLYLLLCKPTEFLTFRLEKAPLYLEPHFLMNTLVVLQPFIREFNYPMARNCAGGDSGVFMSGNVIDEDTGKKLRSLGKLAPTATSEISKSTWPVLQSQYLSTYDPQAVVFYLLRGFGMHVPEEILAVLNFTALPVRAIP
ncbi:hypothetical protein ACJX0J_018611 [Zea mays]